MAETHLAEGRRTPGIELSDEEEIRLFEQDQRTAECRDGWLVFERLLPGKAGFRQERMILPRFCGRRSCQRCGECARKTHLARIDGPWRTFATLTISQPDGGLTDAWRRIAKAMRTLTKWMRENAARNPSDWWLRGKLEYSWVIEAHASGWPHVHMLANNRRIPANELRREWSKIWGRECPQIELKAVNSKLQAIHYVCKYCAKERLRDDILALLYRKRLWACTLPKEEKEDAGWKLTQEMSSDDGELYSENPAAYPSDGSWTVDIAVRGLFARWSRPAPAELVFPEQTGHQARKRLINWEEEEVWDET